jgi:hypothetical protein
LGADEEQRERQDRKNSWKEFYRPNAYYVSERIRP